MPVVGSRRVLNRQGDFYKSNADFGSLAPLPEVIPARSGLGGGLLGGLVVGAGIGIVFAFWHPPFVHSLRHAIVVKAVSVPGDLPPVFGACQCGDTRGIDERCGSFSSQKRKRADLTEQWLDALPQVTQVPWLRIRAEAGILEARGDVQGAIGKLDEVEKQILTVPDSVQREVSLRFLRRWQSELRRT